VTIDPKASTWFLWLSALDEKSKVAEWLANENAQRNEDARMRHTFDVRTPTSQSKPLSSPLRETFRRSSETVGCAISDALQFVWSLLGIRHTCADIRFSWEGELSSQDVMRASSPLYSMTF
jgi:hypothetical protein